MSLPPINFQALAQGPRGSTGGDYPYAIKARDLMKNFIFATLDLDLGMYEETPIGEHVQRRLKIKAGQDINQILYWDGYQYVPFDPPPLDGTYVFGAVNGSFRWIETEACEQ